MVGEWVERTIGEVADIIGGSTPSTKDPSNFDGDIPWLTPKDLSGPHPRYVTRGERNISVQGLSSCSAQLLPVNTVLLSTRAPIGYLAIAANPITTNQGFRNLVVKSDYYHEFLYYWLSANVEELERHASGSTFKELSGASLKRIRLRVPLDRCEQRSIAHILGTLDDKIELNRRMSETLEAMARWLFKSWFVDFDPVRAKTEGRDTGLPGHVADLFPSRLVDSELGEIPEGWKVKSIGDMAEIVGGSTPRTERVEYWEGGVHHWVTPKDLSGLSMPVLLNTERKITDSGLAQISSGLLPRGTVLLSSRAPIGYLAITEIPVAINQGFIAMKAKQGVSNLFLLRWAKAAHEDIISHANGSTFLEISKANFRPIQILAPNYSVMETFDRLSRPLYHKIVEQERESRTLATQRDILLPKLISGELRVKNAERLTLGFV
ncbi:MAG: restriction endonuclease subunit S [Acidobacteriota bacterium]|nr:MAG: restriction endonuclease subunit S [Acidobacteriota bacterium]